MRTQAVLWTLAAVYYAALGLIYVAVGGEAAGTTLLLVASAFGGLLAGWFWHWYHRHPPPVEDLPGAGNIDAPEVVGRYPAASVRPLGIGAAMAGVMLGLVVGLWMTLGAIAILGSQVALLTRDADT